MTDKTKASLRAISEKYVKSQLQHLGSRIPKKEVSRAVKKVSEVLIQLERAKSARTGAR